MLLFTHHTGNIITAHQIAHITAPNRMSPGEIMQDPFAVMATLAVSLRVVQSVRQRLQFRQRHLQGKAVVVLGRREFQQVLRKKGIK